MRAQVLRTFVTIVFSLGSAGLSAQSAKIPDAPLLNVLVWGTHMTIDPHAYSPDVKAELDTLLKRSAAYRSPRPLPVSARDRDIVYGTQVNYERLLVAFADDPASPRLAVKYVDAMRPCYEWEGYHDCPEREASFAVAYQATHPNGPFSEYLPLLAAHRWLCTAEGYDYEKRPQEAARSRRAYTTAIATARRSSALLVRTAAATLAARPRCFS
jgi:hypothetical protein